jgi:hypothetical protein
MIMKKRPEAAKGYASSAGTALRDPKSSRAGKSVAASVLTERAAARSKSAKVLQEVAERDSDALIRLARR